jgi:hypothetical protein
MARRNVESVLLKFSEPGSVDLALDNIIRDVMLAKAALADEREGDFANAVDLLVNRITELHVLVRTW